MFYIYNYVNIQAFVTQETLFCVSYASDFHSSVCYIIRIFIIFLGDEYRIFFLYISFSLSLSNDILSMEKYYLRKCYFKFYISFQSTICTKKYLLSCPKEVFTSAFIKMCVHQILSVIYLQAQVTGFKPKDVNLEK